MPAISSTFLRHWNGERTDPVQHNVSIAKEEGKSGLIHHCLTFVDISQITSPRTNQTKLSQPLLLHRSETEYSFTRVGR
jgi:hypothetical protein